MYGPATSYTGDEIEIKTQENNTNDTESTSINTMAWYRSHGIVQRYLLIAGILQAFLLLKLSHLVASQVYLLQTTFIGTLTDLVTDPTQENTARVLHRSDVPDQIITFDTGTFCGFAGVRIFRTCRQISTEARFIFYSENLWVFAPMHLLPCHILEKQCHFIPWLGREGSSHATKAQKRKRVANLFTPNADRTAFFRQDPLSRFCRTIGRENLSLITKIKIEGSFSGGRNRGRARLGVGSVLPVYTAILDQVCPNLRKIFLSRVDFLSTGIEVETDPIILDGKTEAQYIGGILSTVVSELPQLLELQLGHYVCTVGLGAPYEVPFPPMALDGIFFEDEWKHARGAQKIVEDRKRQREHTSLQDYRKKAATQAREALQKTCGSSIVYG